MCYQRAGALPFPKYGNVLSEDRFQCVRDQNIVCGTGITYGYVTYGPGSVVGIATSYGLDGPGIESRWRSWFRHCSTSRKVAGSIPDGVIGIFHRHNPSGRTMALGLTQPLTEMSTRNISWG